MREAKQNKAKKKKVPQSVLAPLCARQPVAEREFSHSGPCKCQGQGTRTRASTSYSPNNTPKLFAKRAKLPRETNRTVVFFYSFSFSCSFFLGLSLSLPYSSLLFLLFILSSFHFFLALPFFSSFLLYFFLSFSLIHSLIFPFLPFSPLLFLSLPPLSSFLSFFLSFPTPRSLSLLLLQFPKPHFLQVRTPKKSPKHVQEFADQNKRGQRRRRR